ncbi:MAG: hypothetical protein EA360_02380 [Balneolaceae bacterium]|nr:MAG: hypothetical protein EA360_02380 [Balneolaceae bacterium]
MAVLFVFLDGVGIGMKGGMNPLSNPALRSFSWFTKCDGLHSGCNEQLSENHLFKRVDANLNVEGYPQSGTGQTTLFTGINASERIGKHFGPYPHSALKPLLTEESLFRKMIKRGKSPFFLNAYPDIFFKKSESRNRWSCTTLMTRGAGIPLNSVKDVKNGKAVTAEIIQNAWREQLHPEVPEIEPEEASERALNALLNYDLVLYEYYLTDKAGHSKELAIAERILRPLDRFLFKIISDLKESDTLIITSDHGNIENMDVKTHTRNPVPLFVKGQCSFFKNVNSIAEITPSILNLFDAQK